MASSSASGPCSLNTVFKSALSSCPKHMYKTPVQVNLTLLQLSQKLCVKGVIKPSLLFVSLTDTYLAGPLVLSGRSTKVNCFSNSVLTCDKGRYCPYLVSPPISPMGITSMIVMSKFSSPHHLRMSAK